MAGGSGNPYQAASMGLSAAGGLAGQSYNPQTLAGTNLGQYQNPYTRQVINTTMRDMGRANDMALNSVSAQATGAGAWGGARHGIAEAETNRAFLDQAGRMAAGLRQSGFNNAQNAAMFDIGQGAANRQADMAQAGMLAGLSNQAFGYGQQINSDMAAQGAQQQALMQQLINAARGQFGGFAGAPGQSLSYPLAAIGASPVPQTSTTSQQPGLLNILSAGLGLL